LRHSVDLRSGHNILVNSGMNAPAMLRKHTPEVDPEAVAYEFYGWLMAAYVWLAGLAEQTPAGAGYEN